MGRVPKTKKEPARPGSYNPLDKRHLGESVADALLDRPVESLPPVMKFLGAGVYAIYYIGRYPAYEFVASRNLGEQWGLPIYVGKAVPKGARKGLLGVDVPPGDALHKRLREHAGSLRAAGQSLDDFACRYLVVDDIWIPLGESLLIEKFRPLWNVVVEGFGNHTPGKGRFEGMRSPWDMLHPGREWAEKCKPHEKTAEVIHREIDAFREGRLAGPSVADIMAKETAAEIDEDETPPDESE